MNASPENFPQNPEIHPTIETLDQAAQEIKRLYEAFDSAAVPLTPQYREDRLRGAEGITWGKFPKNSPFGRPTPRLEPIIRHRGVILLGAGYTANNEIIENFSLWKDPHLMPNHTTDAIILQRPPLGFSSGEKYACVKGRILRAQYDHYGPTPTINNQGGLLWASSSSILNHIFEEITEFDAKFQAFIVKLQTYDPTRMAK